MGRFPDALRWSFPKKLPAARTSSYALGPGIKNAVRLPEFRLVSGANPFASRTPSKALLRE